MRFERAQRRPGVAIYSASNKETNPASYLYPNSPTDPSWTLSNQFGSGTTRQITYLHWSWFLFNDGNVSQDAFTCPSMLKGGAPRTNPGPVATDWEPGQRDVFGNSGGGGSAPADFRVRRIAYAGNAAVFPRNKFEDASQPRRNKWVKDGEVSNPTSTILVTELHVANNSRSLGASGSGGDDALILSHRSIMPFVGLSSGFDVYGEPVQGTPEGRFRYPRTSEIIKEEQIPDGAISGGAGTILNAVGRIHKGKRDAKGGAANNAFMDGHVEFLTVTETIKDRKWGDRVYSVTGDNKVDVNANRDW